MNNTISHAVKTARTAHATQLRKYTKEPYLTHVFSVAGLVASVTHDEDVIAAALLHDTVEDSELTIENIKELFGPRISNMVYYVTDISTPKDGNRATRKAIEREHISKGSYESKTIKLADLIDNLRTIIPFDSKFAKIFINEKELLLPHLKEGNSVLYKLASDIIKNIGFDKPKLLTYTEFFNEVISNNIKLTNQEDANVFASWKVGGQDFYVYGYK